MMGKAGINLGLSFLLLFSLGCKNTSEELAQPLKENMINEADSLLNNWHQAAAKANFDSYFNAMTSDAIFIGTDATEHWGITEFKEFSKPYFDRGQAWDFKPLDRHVFISEDRETIWFDELLDTWMGLCRGSGVIKKENNQLKIAHYVLSVTVPNDDIVEFIELKKEKDSILTEKITLKN